MGAIARALLTVAVAIALAAPGVASAQFTNAYFFGDSLSDTGSYQPLLPAGTGLFTTNPGPVWVTPFANHYGLTALPANQGGNDYAEGGARVTQSPGYPPFPLGAATPIATQASQLLGKGPVDGNAIYSIQGGSNDIFTQLTALQDGQITPDELSANIVLAARQLAQTVATLQAGGARYVIVWNVPDVGNTPFGKESGLGPQLTGLVQLYNSALFAALDAAGGATVRLNAFGLLNEIAADPHAYGLASATLRACGDTPALLCTPASLVTPQAAQTFFFADGVHPTTAGQAIVAQYAISVLDAPLQMGVLAEAPLAVEQANFRTLDGRFTSTIGAPRSPGNLEAWVAYDYSAPDYSTSYFSGNGDVNTIALGADMRLAGTATVGIMFNYSENKSDYGGAGFRLREPMGTVYGAWADGPWYVGASLGAGNLDFSTTRNVTLGAATRTESGETNGWHFVGRATGGYWFTAGDWVHGPLVKLTYQEIRVRQLEENGASSTTMIFGQQERTSFVTSAGWQAAGRLGAVRPFARATWEYESHADERTVTASVYGMGGSFGLPAYTPDDSWGLFTLGAATEFGKVTGYLSGSATAGKGDGDTWAITVGLRVPL
jgi:outer membrane lipase/esterase